ncbi:DUF6415 family natural product biosynthesis protein [Streptomyces sp. DSM 41527]|uniref:DUF6415 family natural product biosynthesis protein n=1 Tax=Streptomyces mooreae TaxID=3075523 RepID=A0ABU2TFC8_9ACTN|nr:DUF6415 family natural product biosynthesis protein [Streptomyces sp. DSM 41527]MDT0459632.1 DUF6415 family natural product biosynthesis protein [Streptomyces sp. DSM 41527]
MDRPPAAALDSTPQVSIDAATISKTISRALSMGAAPLDLDALVELYNELCEHIGFLLPKPCETTRHAAPADAEAHRLRARLAGIGRQARLPLPRAGLLVHVQVQLLARDCQWLLARHTAEDGR